VYREYKSKFDMARWWLCAERLTMGSTSALAQVPQNLAALHGLTNCRMSKRLPFSPFRLLMVKIGSASPSIAGCHVIDCVIERSFRGLV